MLGCAGLGGDAKEAVHEVARVAVVAPVWLGLAAGSKGHRYETGRVGYRQ